MSARFSYRRLGKPLLDRAAAALLLAILAPCLAIIAVLVRLRLGSPVLFRQVRPGLQGAPFPMFKFRTMTDERDIDGNLLPDDRRLTRFGRLLRSTSLDELPQLWNVLRGDMSLIGPRPLMSEHLELSTELRERRVEVQPGITGWAQINGRNDLDWDTKFAHDAWYVDNLSWRLDLSILLRTIAVVVRREGIQHVRPTPGVHFVLETSRLEVVAESKAAIADVDNPAPARRARPRDRAAA